MSTTITLTRNESLTRVGLPAGKGMVRFGALRSAIPRTVLDSTGAKKASVPLDGAMGETPTTYFLHDRPTSTEGRPAAPSLEALLRFAAATEEMAAARGQLASPEVRFGSQTRTARPGTGSGLALELPARLLEREFGHGKVARFEDVDFPAPLTHEPTRRFLSGTGLPEDGFLFQTDTDIPLPTLAEYCADEYMAAELPQGAGDLIRLGRVGRSAEDNSLVLDGTTGAILTWNEPEAKLYPLTADVSTLAFALWLLNREKTIGKETGGVL